MYNETMVTVQGNVGGHPNYRSVGDATVANFRIAVTPRRFSKATGEWVDAETQWFTVNCWRSLADNVDASIRRGQAVVVHGRLNAKTYVNKAGVEVSTFEIDATAVGHDLNRQVTRVLKEARDESAEAEKQETAVTPGEATAA